MLFNIIYIYIPFINEWRIFIVQNVFGGQPTFSLNPQSQTATEDDNEEEEMTAPEMSFMPVCSISSSIN